MSRRQRIHVEGGTYYVVQRSGINQPIFCRPEDYGLFEALLATRSRSTSTRVHAYCWTPETVHLVLQIEQIPVGRLMQMLTGAYARTVHRQTGESGHLFRERYKAALIEPRVYLPRLVRYVHHVPVLSGLAPTPQGAKYTSHRAYLDRSVVPRWLTTLATLKILESQPDAADDELFMQRAPAPEDVALFNRVGSNDVRVIGGAEFLERVPRHARTHRSRASLETIIHTVTCRMGVDREAVLSRSRQRDLALARALIAWYADARGVAKLSEVARRLGRDSSTLSMGIRHHRRRHPELFKLTAMHDIAPLAPLSTVAGAHRSADDMGETEEGFASSENKDLRSSAEDADRQFV